MDVPWGRERELRHFKTLGRATYNRALLLTGSENLTVGLVERVDCGDNHLTLCLQELRVVPCELLQDSGKQLPMGNCPFRMYSPDALADLQRLALLNELQQFTA